ncbi:mechanosensitive ion channel domain-containing protein [Dokdonella sp.]|uniref:mechanosensitive ion channel family protein n=1 Tax=Dokdonella sp. TaxID=2291710 RepID=UPI001AFDC6B5|nr:mechanosensitive ion channel domain-containing protein [Dokdonella sp.]MBO9662876.1 mechanosensitive ion channel [Dokdonella sp.]
MVELTTLLDKWTDELGHFGLRIAIALLLVVVGVALARRAARALERRLLLRRIDRLLADFIATALSTAGAIMVAIAALQLAGIPTSSFLAALGAAGLAIGLALKDSLAQLAAGVMLMVLRPFRAGEYVVAAGQEGTIESVHLFQTVLRAADNRMITLPNGSITAQPIVNVSRCPTRRVDLNLWVAPDTEVTRALDTLRGAIGGDRRILEQPAPVVLAGDLGERGLLLLVQIWARATDLGSVKSDLIGRIQLALEDSGVRLLGPSQPTVRWLAAARDADASERK